MGYLGGVLGSKWLLYEGKGYGYKRKGVVKEGVWWGIYIGFI